MRVFNASKGQSTTLIKKLPKDEGENVSIKCLRQDKRSRKGYMSTSAGDFQVIDIQTGVVICKIETEMNLKTVKDQGTQQLNEDSSDDEGKLTQNAAK